jgi:hypothetical protein
MLRNQAIRWEGDPRETRTGPPPSIGVEVEEPLFLDEPLDHAGSVPVPDEVSAPALFADEDDPDDTCYESRQHRPVASDAIAPYPAAPEARPSRPALVALLSVIAAVTAFAIAWTLQLYGIPPFAIAHLGR